MPRYKTVNGERIEFTAEEEALRDTEEQAWLEKQSQNDENDTARENLKASAKAKLIAGQPLTEEEADTIVL
tara:strand:- start:177 stop:389 length:213 start_codon:yes stop_codon:yes gene_type:complete